MLEIFYHLNVLMAYLIHPFLILADRCLYDFSDMNPLSLLYQLATLPLYLWRIRLDRTLWVLDFNFHRFLV